MPRLKGPVPQVQAKEGPMPQLVKKRRSGWAVLAVGALVASILAVGASRRPPRRVSPTSSPSGRPVWVRRWWLMTSVTCRWTASTTRTSTVWTTTG